MEQTKDPRFNFGLKLVREIVDQVEHHQTLEVAGAYLSTGVDDNFPIKMRKAELLFFPMPGISHLVPAVEISKLLVQRDETISVTHLIVKLPHDNQTSLYMESVEAGLNRRIELLVLPSLENPVDRSSRSFIELLVEGYKPIVKQIVLDRADGNPGLVVDFFCTGMIDLANEMNVPSYLFFTSAISTLALFLHFQSLRDNHGIDVTQFDNDPDAELDLPVFGNRFPAKLLPQVTLDRSEEGGSNALLNQVKRYRKTKGMIVNSFAELEPRAVRWLSSDATIPPIYPLGPVISFTRKSGGAADGDGVSILRWLDDQPSSSVVFICFGSTGSFREEQVREIAEALERSGLRFLWSLRATPDDLSFEDVLPDGFLGRTAETGRVIGWAPQVAILSHAAVGGFMSHCGWNSTLESVWFGMPVGVWPLFAEQQLNAFMLATELGIAVDIKMDHVWDFRTKLSNSLVKAEEIEKGLRLLMDNDSEIRMKVKSMSELSRKAMAEGGSSYNSLNHFIEDVFKNTKK